MSVSAFVTDPSLFLEKNHLRYAGGVPSKTGGTQAWFGLVPIEKGCRARTGSVFLGLGNKKEDGACFEVRAKSFNHHSLRNPDVDYFPAWWSGYQGGLAVHCELPSNGGPNLMLTPELTGCTVVWTTRANGSARFSHYNLKTADKKMTLDDDQMMQRARNDYGGDANMGSLSKGYYYGLAKREQVSGGKAATGTIIGWRQGGQWSFWAQFVENKIGINQIRKVQQLPAGRSLHG